jgi:hypothetical protein
MGFIAFILALCAAYCFAVIYFTRRLPVWLRQLVCTFLLALVCPVLVAHEGGAAMAPAIFLLTFGLGDLKHDDFTGIAFQVSIVWGVAYCILMVGVGIRYLIRKRGTKHVV